VESLAQFEHLLHHLQDGEIPVSRLHLDHLSDLDRSQISLLRPAWQAIPPARRREVVAALGRLADDDIGVTFESVNRMILDDPDAEVRRQAIENLWECEDPSLVERFIELLSSDGEAQVRSSAAAALGRYVLLGQMDRISPKRLLAAEECLLGAQKGDADDEVRRRCLEALGFSSRAEVGGLIREAYESRSDRLMQSSLLAMGRSASGEWAPEVLAQLRNPAPEVRREAAVAAGELGLKEAVLDLIELLDDVHTEVKRSAIWSLGEIGGPRALRALSNLIEAAEDEDEKELVEDALDNLAFVDGTRDFVLFDLEDLDTEDP
jgi:HEAT repeat protein